jgi:hypothetical protein
MKAGLEPKLARRPEYLNALKNYARDSQTWEKEFYSSRLKLEISTRIMSRKLISRSRVEDHKLIASFIDFEAWFRNFFGLR